MHMLANTLPAPSEEPVAGSEAQLRATAFAYFNNYFAIARPNSLYQMLVTIWKAQTLETRTILASNLTQWVRDLGGYANLPSHLRWFIDIYVMAKYMTDSNAEHLLDSGTNLELLNDANHPFFGVPESTQQDHIAVTMLELENGLLAAKDKQPFWRPLVFNLIDRPDVCHVAKRELRDLLGLRDSQAEAHAEYLLTARLPGWKVLSMFGAP